MLLNAVMLAEEAFVPPLATGRAPVTPAVNGRPVAFVSTAADGVPKAGVVNVGDVVMATLPEPDIEYSPSTPLLSYSTFVFPPLVMAVLAIVKVGAAHVLSPRRNVVVFAVPVADRLDVPMLVNDAPEPLNVVAVTVPVTLTAPLNVEVPTAICPDHVELAPATVPVSVGAADSTTFPDPVDAVVQTMFVLLLAVQKLLVVSVPNVVVELVPIAIQLVPLQ